MKPTAPLALALAAGLAVLVARCKSKPARPTDVSDATVIGGLDRPSALLFTPDGDLLVSEKRTGRLVRVTGTGVGETARSTLLADLGPVDGSSERGLLGLAVHPGWSDGDRRVYAYRTVKEPSDRQQVVRLTDGPDGRRVGEATVVLDDLPAAPPGSRNHDGGVMVMRFEDVGGARKAVLYVHTGDNAIGQRRAVWPHPSQTVLWTGADGTVVTATAYESPGCEGRRYTLHGKILRVLDDGSPPGDNPQLTGALGHTADPRCSPIWAMGLRNGYGLRFHPSTGALWHTDNGNVIADEINVIERGGNYGWPCMHGTTKNDDDPGPPGAFDLSGGWCDAALKEGRFRPPAFVDPGAPGRDTTPGYANMAFITRCEAYGKARVGDAVWTSSDGRILRGRVQGDQIVDANTSWFVDRMPVDVVEGPDGLLYYADLSRGQIRRLHPVTPVDPKECTSGS